MVKITHHSKIRISRFYEEILGAKMKNRQWSWGAEDPASGRVFLNVWNDLLDKNKVQVCWKEYENKSNGDPERLKHLAAIRGAAKCFGVLCEVVDPDAEQRKIKTFDDEQLLLLGNLSEDDTHRYARILGRFPTSAL